MWIAFVVGLVLVTLIFGWKGFVVGIAGLIGAGFWATNNLIKTIEQQAPYGTKTIALQMVPLLLKQAAMPWQKSTGVSGSLADLGKAATLTALENSGEFRQAWYTCQLLGPFCYPAYICHVYMAQK